MDLKSIGLRRLSATLVPPISILAWLLGAGILLTLLVLFVITIISATLNPDLPISPSLILLLGVFFLASLNYVIGYPLQPKARAVDTTAKQTRAKEIPIGPVLNYLDFLDVDSLEKALGNWN